MQYATVEFIGNVARVTDSQPLTCGTVGGVVAISFDESWDGMAKTLVWKGGGVTIDDTTCSGIIPAEVLRKHGSWLYVGAYGTKDGKVTPSVWANLGKIQPGVEPCGDRSTVPSLPVWAQVQATAARAVNIARGAEASALRICPDLAESGSIVACEPLSGYPLTVQTEDNATAVYRNGKNQFDVTAYPFKENSYIRRDNGNAVGGVSAYWSTTVYIPVHHLRGSVITLNHIPAGDFPGMAFYNESKAYISGGKGSAIIVPDTATYMRFTVNAGTTDAQIEIGSTATEYEPYRTPDEFAPGEAIPALDGVNTIWADSGDVSVSGKADPTAIIEKLTNAIISLGGNV